MKITVDTNALQVSRFMREVGRSQLPFATSLGINSTARDFQAAQRAHMAEAFTIRRPFLLQAVKIKPFSTKQSLEAVVRIDPPGGAARADIITRHEEDAERSPQSGGTLAVPSEARPSPTALVPKQLLPKRLGLRGQGSVLRGKQRTFLARGPDGRGGIFQRTGPGSHGTFRGTRKLFALTGPTPLDQRLNFFETAETVIPKVWPDNFANAWNRALETA